MQLATHHKFALAGALGLSAIAVFDAVTHGMTGHWSVFSDDGDIPWVRAIGDVVHGVAYAGGLWVLGAEGRRIRVNKPATVFGWLLVVAFTPLTVGFLTFLPVHAFGPADGLYDALTPVIGVAFALQFLGAIGLGLGLLRHPESGPGSRLLQAIVPVIGATALLALLAQDWAHPAYVEVCVIVGVALLGAAEPARRNAPVRAPVVA